MAEAMVLGLDCKLYVNDEDGSGTIATPVWLDMADVLKNGQLNLKMGEADVTTRGAGGIEQYEPVLNGVEFTGELIWRNDNDNCNLLWTKYNARAAIDCLILTGASNNADARGVRGDMKIFGFGRKEDLTDTVRIDITLKPCLSLGTRDNAVAAATGA